MGVNNMNNFDKLTKPQKPFLLIYLDEDMVSYGWFDSEKDLVEAANEVISYGCKIECAIEIHSSRTIEI